MVRPGTRADRHHAQSDPDREAGPRSERLHADHRPYLPGQRPVLLERIPVLVDDRGARQERCDRRPAESHHLQQIREDPGGADGRLLLHGVRRARLFPLLHLHLFPQEGEPFHRTVGLPRGPERFHHLRRRHAPRTVHSPQRGGRHGPEGGGHVPHVRSPHL